MGLLQSKEVKRIGLLIFTKWRSSEDNNLERKAYRPVNTVFQTSVNSSYSGVFWKDLKIGVIGDNLGALTTQARKFCWSGFLFETFTDCNIENYSSQVRY